MQISLKLKEFGNGNIQITKSLIKSTTIDTAREVLLAYVDISIEEVSALINYEIEMTSNNKALIKFSLKSIKDKNIQKEIDDSIRIKLYNKFENNK